jgi:hypothetical protein
MEAVRRIYSIGIVACYPINCDGGSLNRFDPHGIFMTSLPTTTPLSKAGVNYTYGDSNHDQAVTGMGSDSYSYDANGNQITRNISGNSYTLGYDAENRTKTVQVTRTKTVQVTRTKTVQVTRLVSVSGSATLTAFDACTATFVYDGDGNRQ